MMKFGDFSGMYFQPLYYMGWIIQPSLEGYFVYDREDHRASTADRFDSLEEAYRYIDEQVSKGV